MDQRRSQPRQAGNAVIHAIFSPCRQYRYRLFRQFGMNGRTVAFVGVNPSIGDETINDASIRKMCGFAVRWGFDQIDLVNLFAWISTDVRELGRVPDPIGRENDTHISEALAGAHLVVACWGSRLKLPQRIRPRMVSIREIVSTVDAEVCCLGKTQYGDPRHPLMLSYRTALEPWP